MPESKPHHFFSKKTITALAAFVVFVASLFLFKRPEQSLISYGNLWFFAFALQIIGLLIFIFYLYIFLKEKTWQKKSWLQRVLHGVLAVSIFLMPISSFCFHYFYYEQKILIQPGESVRLSRADFGANLISIITQKKQSNGENFYYKTMKALKQYKKNSANYNSEQKAQARLELEILIANAFQEHIQIVTQFDPNRYFIEAERKFMENNEILFDALLKNFEWLRIIDAGDELWLKHFEKMALLAAQRFYIMQDKKDIKHNDPLFHGERIEWGFDVVNTNPLQYEKKVQKASASYTSSTQLTRQVGESFLFYAGEAKLNSIQNFLLVEFSSQDKKNSFNNPYLLAEELPFAVTPKQAVTLKNFIAAENKIGHNGFIKSYVFDKHLRPQSLEKNQYEIEIPAEIKDDYQIKEKQSWHFIEYVFTRREHLWLLHISIWAFLLSFAALHFYKNPITYND